MQRCEARLDERLGSKLPQRFSRLKGCRIGRPKRQVQTIRALNFGARVVGGVVQQNERLMQRAGLNKISTLWPRQIKGDPLNAGQP